mmetsp:Transcript_54466/g.95152  ORF Transcript_54466/g.95152 Transcript_54466/m.95152 type:complete len:203 (-) Transcript_54466:1814-2422(-)
MNRRGSSIQRRRLQRMCPVNLPYTGTPNTHTGRILTVIRVNAVAPIDRWRSVHRRCAVHARGTVHRRADYHGSWFAFPSSISTIRTVVNAWMHMRNGRTFTLFSNRTHKLFTSVIFEKLQYFQHPEMRPTGEILHKLGYFRRYHFHTKCYTQHLINLFRCVIVQHNVGRVVHLVNRIFKLSAPRRIQLIFGTFTGGPIEGRE